jgi:hypothetical protein
VYKRQVWINTNSPICSILVTDLEGSGVSARDVEYSISTTNVYEYGPWFRVSGIRDSELVRASVKVSFVDGKTNFIRFRARDVAGNGWAQSPDYNVWVDVLQPSFTNFQPFEGDYQGSDRVVVSVDISDRHGLREGSGVIPNSVEYRVSVAGVGLFGDWKPATIVEYKGETVKVAMELDLEDGDQNYVQFRAIDGVGNYVTSRPFNVKVNSAPVIVASISAPVNGEAIGYTTSELILFDASRTSDPDGDILEFEWYSDIDGLLSTERSFYRSLQKGTHIITLIVNDPAHAEAHTFEMSVREYAQVDLESIDSDGDGIYDAWEESYGLNPFKRDSDVDTDFDTFTNLQEFEAKTDPTNRNSHPPYETVEVSDVTDDDATSQFQLLTLTIVLVSVLVMIALLALAYSKRRNFLETVDEEKDLEKEEVTYRDSIRKKL